MSAEIESLSEFDRMLGAGGVRGATVQSVDLRDRSSALATADVSGTVFLGCEFAPDSVAGLRRRGALVFPRLPDVPMNPYRAGLYTARELYDHGTAAYESSLDAVVYRWTRQQDPHDIAFTLATALHDHAIDDGISDLMTNAPRAAIGIMGGHAIGRGTPDYEAAARLGHRLAGDGALVATGGGPGAMEAANLGAWCRTAEQLEAALPRLAEVPDFRPGIDAWAAAALQIADADHGRLNLGVPTWHYGHEPPNVFATHIAKYFSNALREDMLLRLCRGGLIFLPGAAGTVQELFQATTANYYAAEATDITPLVLVGPEQWTDILPAWPLLRHLARGRTMADDIAIVATVEEAHQFLTERRRSRAGG